MQYKKILTRITIAFVGIVVFLTFFSRTLADLHVPRVSVYLIRGGAIGPEAMSSGILMPADTEIIFSPASGRITQIVEVGDDITARSVLFTVSSDMQTLMDNLTQAEHERSVNALNIDRTRSEQLAEQQRLNQMIAEPASVLTTPILRLWEYDMQLESNTNDVARIMDELEALEILYDEGIIPRQSILDRETELVRLAQAREQIYQRRNLAIQNHELAMEAYEVSVANQGRNRQAQITSQRERVTQIGFTLDMHMLETDRIASRINDLLEQIEAGGVMEVLLEDGTFSNRTVSELMPGIMIGSLVHEGAPVMMTTFRNHQFVIEASFPQDDDFIRRGQAVEILIGDQTLEGRTSRITPDGARNIATIEVNAVGSRVSGGELAMVTIMGARMNHAAIIPVSALRTDGQGYFILFVERVEQTFGSSYYARIERVRPDVRDANNVAITSFSPLPEGPIIVNSDMPVRPGERVRLVADYAFVPTR